LFPDDCHPLVNALTKQQIVELMENLKTLINRTVDKIPSHDDFLDSL
jgi:tryptophan halogenase